MRAPWGSKVSSQSGGTGRIAQGDRRTGSRSRTRTPRQRRASSNRLTYRVAREGWVRRRRDHRGCRIKPVEHRGICPSGCLATSAIGPCREGRAFCPDCAWCGDNRAHEREEALRRWELEAAAVGGAGRCSTDTFAEEPTNHSANWWTKRGSTTKSLLGSLGSLVHLLPFCSLVTALHIKSRRCGLLRLV
jgi:hypothetical protein